MFEIGFWRENSNNLTIDFLYEFIYKYDSSLQPEQGHGNETKNLKYTPNKISW